MPEKKQDTPGLVEISRRLSAAVSPMTFTPPVAYVYNPLEYAQQAHEQYLVRWGRGRREVVLLGMNPGPWGMAQTGTPFGEVGFARDWLGVEAPIGKPVREHPKRPVEGFACRRSEVSGSRLWGWARDRFLVPERFFLRFFVYNYCPLCFMEASGRNRTPDKLPAAERGPLFEACDQALRQVCVRLSPRLVVGIGKFAEARARIATEGLDLRVGGIPHPSPANPAANRDWAKMAEMRLAALGVVLPDQSA